MALAMSAGVIPWVLAAIVARRFIINLPFPPKVPRSGRRKAVHLLRARTIVDDDKSVWNTGGIHAKFDR